MKITVELEENDLRDICRFTGEKKKGPAIRKLIITELLLRRRREIADKFMSGKSGVELAGYEKNRAKDREINAALHAQWRE